MWSNFKNTVSMWGKTSVTTAVGNILLHPLVIIFIIMILCILFQICIMIRMRQFYKLIKKEMKKGEEIMTGIFRRKVTTDLTDQVMSSGTSGTTDTKGV